MHILLTLNIWEIPPNIINVDPPWVFLPRPTLPCVYGAVKLVLQRLSLTVIEGDTFIYYVSCGFGLEIDP